MKVSPLLIGIAILLGAWAYFGFPSPDTLLAWSNASDECVKFAKENRDKIFFGQDSDEIKAVSSWLKNGKVVVQVGAFEPNATSYTPRLCVLGGGQIEIVSILENSAWR
jgi:hypothetical protein